jgi:hypothetical protein
MKHLQSYKIFEGLKNPIADYTVQLEDLGFVAKLDDSDIGHLELNLKSKDLTDEFKMEIMDEYLTLIERLKDEWIIKSHLITFFNNNNVSIVIDRKVKDISQEVEMSPEQKLAYDSICSTIDSSQSLRIYRISGTWIQFNKFNSRTSSSDIMWISIYGDGRVELPILRGRKSQSVTELPFTIKDVKWFKRILWVDDNYKRSTEDEFDILHKKSQSELREIY